MKVFHNPETNELAIESDPGSLDPFVVFDLNKDQCFGRWVGSDDLDGAFRRVKGFEYDESVRDKIAAYLSDSMFDTFENRAEKVLEIIKENN